MEVVEDPFATAACLNEKFSNMTPRQSPQALFVVIPFVCSGVQPKVKEHAIEEITE